MIAEESNTEVGETGVGHLPATHRAIEIELYQEIMILASTLCTAEHMALLVFG